MLKIEKSESAALTVLTLSGDVRKEHLPEFCSLIDGALERSDEVHINCGDIRLIDREVVRYLAACRYLNVRLVDVPPYVHSWLRSERGIVQ